MQNLINLLLELPVFYFQYFLMEYKYYFTLINYSFYEQQKIQPGKNSRIGWSIYITCNGFKFVGNDHEKRKF